MKKLLSWLLILSLLVGTMGTTFAGTIDIKGYATYNPMGLNSEMKMTNLKTANGTWKNASIKVSEVQIDNVGYKKINDTQEVKYSDSTLRKLDAVKVKITYTFSEFIGNKDSLIKNNLLTERIDAVNSKRIYKDGGQFYSGFANGLFNKVEKYNLNGKTYKGEWYGKKIKDINFSKPVSMSGYVYLVLDKGKTEGAFVNFVFSSKNEVDQSEAYFVFSNKMLESRIKNTGIYIYGDEKVGYVKPTFEMTAYPYEGEYKNDDSVVLNYYRVGTESDPVLLMGLLKSSDTFGEEGIKKGIEDYVDGLVEDYGVEKKLENEIYVIKGISEDIEKYMNVHVINKGSYFNVVIIRADINEKANADKLWESYKANNDLTKNTTDTTKTAADTTNKPADTTSKPKETSKKPVAKYTYGMGLYGTFSSLEELVEDKGSDTAILRYKSKSGDAFYTMQFWGNGQMNIEGLDKNIKEMFPDSVVGKLDNGNITVYTDNSYTYDSATVLLITKNGQIYTFIVAVPKKAEAQKETVIKSYLISLGYTEQQAETLAASAIFD